MANSPRFYSVLVFVLVATLAVLIQAIPREDEPAVLPGTDSPAAFARTDAPLLPRGPARERVPPPEHLLAVFPDLREDVRDWRHFSPETFVLRLAPGVEASFRLERIEEDSGRTVITARLDREGGESSPLDSVFLVGTAGTRDRWTGLAVFPGMEYHVEIQPGQATVEEVPMEDFFCKSCIQGHPSETAPHADIPYASAANAADVATANAMLANSQITTFHWRYVGAVAAPSYPTSTNLSDDLTAMSRSGALASFVADQQRTRKADQVVLLAGGIKTPGTGVAWSHGIALHSVVNYPFTTNSNGVRSTGTSSPLLVSHEMMHNLGARHGRDDLGGPMAVDGDGYYGYGYVFSDSTFTPARPTATIMAAGGVRIPHFSNPDVSYNGHPTGIPVGQPRAAHVARMAAEFAPLAAAASDAESVPVITQGPASVSLTAGDTLTLSVAASGGGVTYRWGKDGTGIATTVGPTLTIPNVTFADAGSYVVVAVNFLGFTGSAPATVSVVSPPPPPPSSGGGSGGGGGGGAMPGWVALALMTLLALRGRRP